VLLFIPLIRNRVLRWDEIEQKRNRFWDRMIVKLEPFRRFYRENAVIRFRYNLVCHIHSLFL
jgi:hypothetical protein